VRSLLVDLTTLRALYTVGRWAPPSTAPTPAQKKEGVEHAHTTLLPLPYAIYHSLSLPYTASDTLHSFNHSIIQSFTLYTHASALPALPPLAAGRCLEADKGIGAAGFRPTILLEGG
jgi:hypothetical protein